MSLSGHPSGYAMSYDPYGPDEYKRAVYLPAPARFTVEFLEPTKQGHSYSYGMRISAISRGDRLSTSSTRSLSEYVIWRRWEDSLWFQDSLEQEYGRRAREKKQRLLRGKGVKKNGFYMQDHAASFESLPPGPHPDSVAQDIHQYLPRLTKKGTLFRASQATINQRNSELRALVEALYQDDLPTLIIEMRESHVVTDFFGYWRRDFDLYESAQKRDSGSSARSIISSYFSPSHVSLSHQDSSNRSSHDVSGTPPRLHSFAASEVPSTPDIVRSRFHPARHCRNQSAASLFSRSTPRPRALSIMSTDSSSSGSDRSSDASTVSSTPSIIDEVPITFAHSPQESDPNLNERPHSMLEVLSEEIDVMADSLALMSSVAAKRRRRSASANLHLNTQGNFRRHASPPLSPTRSELTPVPEQDQPEEETRVYTAYLTHSSTFISTIASSVRESWMSTDSASTYLEGLKLSLPPERANRASVLTVMTTDSAEAIRRPVSRSLPTSPVRPSSSVSLDARFSQAITLSDFDIWTNPGEDEDGSVMESALGTGRTDSFPRPVSLTDSFLELRPESPLGYRDISTPIITEKPLPSFFSPVPPSPTASTISGSVSIADTSLSSISSIPEDMISIKAVLNQSIVVLRVPRLISYEELREKLHDKFSGQEGLPLSKLFTIALTSGGRHPANSGRGRSGSVTSAEQMEFIESQNDWNRAVGAHERGKLILRILDTPS